MLARRPCRPRRARSRTRTQSQCRQAATAWRRSSRLSYSSHAPIYGGIAAGWSLAIPEIREDTSQGRLRTHSPEVEATQSDPRADDRFISTMAGGRPLIAVTEPTSAGVYKTYRAQNDSSFTRYERMDQGQPFRWRAYTTDGSTLYFGETDPIWNCQHVSDGFAPLTRVVDAFGNEVLYLWEAGSDHECRIARITWGQNAAAGLLQPFARVVFTWELAPTCGGVHTGSQIDYRTGVQIVTGASKLWRSRRPRSRRAGRSRPSTRARSRWATRQRTRVAPRHTRPCAS